MAEPVCRWCGKPFSEHRDDGSGPPAKCPCGLFRSGFERREEASAAKTEHLVWWLSKRELEPLRSPYLLETASLPVWLRGQLQSCERSAGLGRLRKAEQFNTVEIAKGDGFGFVGWLTPLGRYVERRCAGIVITRAELPLLATLPGIVTDLELRRVA